MEPEYIVFWFGGYWRIARRLSELRNHQTYINSFRTFRNVEAWCKDGIITIVPPPVRWGY